MIFLTLCPCCNWFTVIPSYDHAYDPTVLSWYLFLFEEVYQDLMISYGKWKRSTQCLQVFCGMSKLLILIADAWEWVEIVYRHSYTVNEWRNYWSYLENAQRWLTLVIDIHLLSWQDIPKVMTALLSCLFWIDWSGYNSAFKLLLLSLFCNLIDMFSGG